ncbi:MAG TPA: cellulase family glycosylhydrolase [Solimonas sp.]|nr:cellulase family glycosylhydrolase [Solimonas sp.]
MRNTLIAGCGLLLALLSGCHSSTPGGSTPAPEGAEAPQLRRDGRWLVDPQGRVVLLHGVNMVWKEAPFYPPATAEGFLAQDADWLAEHGFNNARIGTLWVGVAPEQGVIDQAYLAQWDRVIQLLASRKIWMLFDFHQDLLGPLYQGEGVPEWAVEEAKGPLTTLLGPPSFGFPFNYFTPQLSQAFDRFWVNTGIRDNFAQAWSAVAQRWANQPYSMGYDLMNEPWAGLDYPTCLIPLTGCPAHDRDSLQPFFEQARAAIRQVDAHNIVWFQSQPMTSTGAPTGFEAVPGEAQLGFSFHYYCPLNTLANSLQLGLLDSLPVGLDDTCSGFGNRVFDQARAQAERMDGVELLSEFGATDELQVLGEVTAEADERLVGWQYWQYKNWRDPTTESQGSSAQSLFTDDADLTTAKTEKLRVLVRTYPQATAGVPQSLAFDPGTGEFNYRYTPRAAGGPTEIYVPLALHYPQGYVLEVSGARRLSAADAGLLQLENLPGATEVTVHITRR